MTRDEAAVKMYGHPFDKLSAWAQSSVIHALEAVAPKPVHTTTLNDVNETAHLASLTARVRVLEEERDDLWEENQTLLLENARMRHELNLPEGVDVDISS